MRADPELILDGSLTQHRQAQVILALSHVIIYVSLGLVLPLASSALLTLGLSPAFIGVAIAGRSLMLIVAPPLWAALADWRGGGVGFAMASLGLGGLALAWLAGASTPEGVLLGFVAYGLLGAPIESLLAGLTLSALGPDKQRYGSIRLFGTAGYGIGAVGGSLLIDAEIVHATPGFVFGASAILSLLGVAILGSCPRLPRPPLSRLRDLLELRKERWLGLLLLAASLHWASHSAYVSFYVPLGLERDVSPRFAGYGLAIGIVAEVLCFRLVAPLMRRFGARWLLRVAFATACGRWLWLALTHDLVSYVAAQALNGITFSFFIGVVVTTLGDRLPGTMRQSGQGLFMSLVMGLGSAAGTLLAGALVNHGERVTWGAMAALALLALWVYERPAARA